MQGQITFRATGQKTNSGKDMYVVLGVVGIEEGEINDGFKYDLLDIAMMNGEDFTQMNNSLSPEDLLEKKIWKIKQSTYNRFQISERQFASLFCLKYLYRRKQILFIVHTVCIIVV